MKHNRILIHLFISLASLLWFTTTVAHAQSTTTLHGTGLQPLVEESGTTQTLNIYGPGGVIIAQVATDSPAGGPPTTQTRYLLHDHLGSTRVVLDSNNQVLGSFDYSPFGETTVSNGAAGNVADVAYRYTGQEVNGALGTYNYHARHYDAGVGRFLGVDPARQFASSYAYVGNNPINGVDPTGGIDIPVDAETYAQLGRASRAIEWARKQASYTGNSRSDVVATHAESYARATLLRNSWRELTSQVIPDEPILARAGLAATVCSGLCDELSALTFAYLTFVEPDPARPILSVKDTTPSHKHTLTLIGDPRQLPPEQVIVADAWPTHPQAARLSDIQWRVHEITERVFPTPELAQQHQTLFSFYQRDLGQAWASFTQVPPGTGYNLANPEDPINFIGRRALGITDFDGYTSNALSDPYLRDVSYGTNLAESYNYIPSGEWSAGGRNNALGVTFDPFGIAADIRGIR